MWAVFHFRAVFCCISLESYLPINVLSASHASLVQNTHQNLNRLLTIHKPYTGAKMIKVGDTLPATTLMEFSEVEGNGCSIGPNPVDVAKAAAGKTIALFALPGAFTPTCSAKHIPSYVGLFNELKANGVDEIWCVSVNDAFVMGAWARDQKTDGKIRMLADGSADFSKATGLTLDLSARGMGLRSNRYSMLVKDGKVVSLNVEAAGKFEVSDAATMLAQAKA
jgi:peroxiredoxin